MHLISRDQSLELIPSLLTTFNISLNKGDCLVAEMVKNLSTMQETQVQSVGREDPLEKGMSTQPRILTWRIPWIEEPGEL